MQKKIVSLSSGGKSSSTHGGGGGRIRRNSRARQPSEELHPNSWEGMDPIELLSDYNYPAAVITTLIRRMPPYKRRLTGYCGWKIWNTNSGKTCDQVAQELVTNNNSNNNNVDGSTILLTVAQAKSQILPEGCICAEGEKSFDENVITPMSTPMAFCGKCRYRNASFTCDDRVEFVMANYPEDNPTLNKAKMNLLRRGDCIDRNWTPYALKVEINGGGGGLSAGAIAGIVLAALALCCASMVGCCILRDLKKAKSNNGGGEEGDTEMKGSAVAAAVVAKEKLNVIEEGDEGEEEESVMGGGGGAEMSVSAGSSVPQSSMADDVTEIITNGRNRGE